MRAAIYNPYLDTLGGGERYTITFAKVLLDAGWNVDIEWKGQMIKEKLSARFGLNLANLNFIPDIRRGDGYDLCFWVSDGSIPLLKSRKNLLHFQVPFHNLSGNNLLNKMKLIRVDKIICNSLFTKKFIDKEFGVDSVVVYPPVDTKKIKPKRKENIILSVARFSELLQNKRQDLLIETFKGMVDKGLKGWKLLLAGGVEVGVGDYLSSLSESSEGYPIEIVKSPNFNVLKDLYGKSKIFWSAAGYGVNSEETPEKVEHFGITVVEALSGGCVPVVFEAGGHEEIVSDGVNGFLWKDKVGLVEKTNILINNRNLLMKIKESSILSSSKYGYENFSKAVLRLLE